VKIFLGEFMKECILLFVSCFLLIFTVSVSQAQPLEKKRPVPFESPRRGDPPGWGPRSSWSSKKPYYKKPASEGLPPPVDKPWMDAAPEIPFLFNRFRNKGDCVGSLPRYLKEYKTPPPQEDKAGNPLCSVELESSALVPEDSEE
jgi:hypothetical protein